MPKPKNPTDNPRRDRQPRDPDKDHPRPRRHRAGRDRIVHVAITERRFAGGPPPTTLDPGDLAAPAVAWNIAANQHRERRVRHAGSALSSLRSSTEARWLTSSCSLTEPPSMTSYATTDLCACRTTLTILNPVMSRRRVGASSIILSNQRVRTKPRHRTR